MPGVKAILGAAATAFALWLAPVAGHAAVLTFDDIATDSIGTIPDGYGGFDWTNMGYIHESFHPGSGYDNGVVSGTYVAFNQFAAIGRADGLSFDFNGAWLTAAWNNGLNILVEGLIGGITTFATTVVVDTTGPTWFSFNFLGIDAVRFTSFGGVDAGLGGGGTHFAMDDFTFNEATEVPEPGTLLLLTGPLLAAGLMTRRRRTVA